MKRIEKLLERLPLRGSCRLRTVAFPLALMRLRGATTKIKFMRFPSQSSAYTIPFISRSLRGLTAPPVGEPTLNLSFCYCITIYSNIIVFSFYNADETYRKATREAPPPGELPPSNSSFSSCLDAAERGYCYALAMNSLFSFITPTIVSHKLLKQLSTSVFVNLITL